MIGAPAGLAEALTGRFTLVRELGRGGMGIVFLARETALDRDVALKVLPPDLAAQAELRARFLREARTAASLSHPHIVPVHSADETGGFAWFAMGFVDGETLGQRLQARGRLGPAEAVRILREAAWALAYAHARGVVHRDVKPDNLMLERASGRVLVTDFGIARQAADARLTADGNVLGTVQFMSPEQVTAAPLDGRSDLYALGVIGFLLLSGRLPFEEAAPSAVLVAHATKPAPLLRSVAPDVPAPLADVIDRCLAKDPAARYATGEALAEALAAALEAAPPSPETPVPQVLSTAQAEQIWLRAAQLQMDAATAIRQKTQVVGAPAAGVPTSGYRREDVEAAAAEVGIAKEFVQLALAELPAAGDAVVPVSDAEDERITKVLGTAERSLRVSRIIEAPAAQVLEAFGEIGQRAPYRLQLLDTIGGHPLDGGVMSFAVPRGAQLMVEGNSVNMFVYRMEQLEIEQVSVALHPLAGAVPRTEIVITTDLRSGARENVKWSVRVARGLAGTIGVSIGGVGGGLAFAQGALAAGAFWATAGVLGAAAVAALSYGGWRYSYRGALKGTVAEFDGLLAAVGASIRGRAVFGRVPPQDPPRVPPGDGGVGGVFGSV